MNRNRKSNSVIYLLVLLFCPIIILLIIGGAFLYMIPIFVIAYYISTVSVDREFRKKEKEIDKQRLEKELTVKLEKEKEINEKENQIKRVINNNIKINNRVDFLLKKVDEMKLQSTDESELNFDNDIKYLIELFYISKVFRLPSYYSKKDESLRSREDTDKIYAFWLSLKPQISVEVLTDIIQKKARISVIAAIADSVNFKESFDGSRIHIDKSYLTSYALILDLKDLSRFKVLHNSSFSDTLESNVSKYIDILTAKNVVFSELLSERYNFNKTLTKEENFRIKEVLNNSKTIKSIENELSKKSFEYVMNERESGKSDIIERVVRANVVKDKFIYNFENIDNTEDQHYSYCLRMNEDEDIIISKINSSINEVKNMYINNDELKKELNFSYLDGFEDEKKLPDIKEIIAEKTEKDSINYSSLKIKEFHNNNFEYHGSSNDTLTKLKNPNYAVEFKNNLAKNGFEGNFDLFLSDIYNESIKHFMSDENWKSKLIEIIEEKNEELTQEINEMEDEIKAKIYN